MEMQFHGFRSVSEWLDVARREIISGDGTEKHYYVITEQTWARKAPEPDYSKRTPQEYYRQYIPGVQEMRKGQCISTETLPYGDPISDIADDRPEKLKVVVMTIDTDTACLSLHVFSEDFSKYYARGLGNGEEQLNLWGYEPCTPLIKTIGTKTVA